MTLHKFIRCKLKSVFRKTDKGHEQHESGDMHTIGCPFLEELVLLDCYLVNLNNIVISSSTLKSLTIHDLPYFGEFDETSGCNIKIDAVNLTYFKYFGNLLNDILLDNALSLVNACIHIPIPQERETEVTYRAIDLLKQLRYVVSLRISNRIIESLIFADNMVHYSPVFSNLRHLVLTMESGKYPFGGLMDLLYFCPILQSICLLEGFEHHMCLGENDPILILVPICMLICMCFGEDGHRVVQDSATRSEEANTSQDRIRNNQKELYSLSRQVLMKSQENGADRINKIITRYCVGMNTP
ncbi:unnamed protein product [Lactuca virosa]|uniref:Uncharacterized protein n=1 Tax=Lactuca virosa TaxID=75947 RepID=A0AAU9PIE4_9ASTR|nr:unnamed protein product [Lactuca virosa]